MGTMLVAFGILCLMAIVPLLLLCLFLRLLLGLVFLPFRIAGAVLRLALGGIAAILVAALTVAGILVAVLLASVLLLLPLAVLLLPFVVLWLLLRRRRVPQLQATV